MVYKSYILISRRVKDEYGRWIMKNEREMSEIRRLK